MHLSTMIEVLKKLAGSNYYDDIVFDALKELGVEDESKKVDSKTTEEFFSKNEVFPTTISFAWISPSGEINILKSGQTHNDFAKSLGESIESLIQKNWIKVSNPFTIEIKNHDTLKRQSFKSFVKNITRPFLLSDKYISQLKKGIDFEKEPMYIYFTDLNKMENITLIKFLKQYDRDLIEDIYEKLFA